MFLWFKILLFTIQPNLCVQLVYEKIWFGFQYLSWTLILSKSKAIFQAKVKIQILRKFSKVLPFLPKFKQNIYFHNFQNFARRLIKVGSEQEILLNGGFIHVIWKHAHAKYMLPTYLHSFGWTFIAPKIGVAKLNFGFKKNESCKHVYLKKMPPPQLA